MRPYYYLGERRGLTQLATGQMFIVNTEARDLATWIIHYGVWETFVDDILSDLARPGDTVVDIGANMGYYTIKLGGLVGPTGRVVSYEPNPDLFDVLHDNVQINGFGGKAHLFQACAGEEAGSTSLTFQRRFPGGGVAGLGPEFLSEGREQAEVKMVRVDDTFPGGEAHLIKIDVEGFEPLVVKGMKDLLARSADAAIVLEVSYANWARFGDPAEQLRDLAGGRLLYRIHLDGKLEPLPADKLDDRLPRQFPAYMLLLPNTPARLRQIAARIDSRRREGNIHDKYEPLPPPPTLMARIKGKLSRMLQ